MSNSEDAEFSVLTVDLEHQSLDKKTSRYKGYFSNGDGVKVKTGSILTSEEAFSGSRSILLTQKAKYGLSIKLTDIKLDEYYKVSVWRKDKKKLGALVVSSQKNSHLYLATSVASESREDGWEKLEIEVEVPPLTESISIYSYIAKSDSAYFDDLVVQRIDSKKYKKYARSENLSIYFDEKQMDKFNRSRENAFREGIYFNDGIWNKGVLFNGEEVLPIKARFKGDWLDHLRGLKWSFRVKVRKGKTFNRLRVFSLQNTASRYHLHEYLSHQLFLQEGLLTTRYDFAPLYINGESRGIYAIEEHFTKQLIESSLRREGLILKYDENPMWRNTAIHQGLNAVEKWERSPSYQTSRVLTFGMSKTLKNENLKQQFLIGHGLLHNFKVNASPIEELFDIEKLAKFLALTDLHQGRHGTVWHNLRFYYNPISCKLELINYDNFTDYFKLKAFKPLGLTFKKDIPLDRWSALYPSMFKSEELCEKYYLYLEKYSSAQFVNDFYAKHRKKIDQILPLIKDEFPTYHLDSSYLLNNAAVIRSYLPELKNKIDSGFFKAMRFVEAQEEYSQKYSPTLFPYYLNAYYFNTSGETTLLVENFNNRKVELIRLLDGKKRPLTSLRNITIDKFEKTQGSDTLLISYFPSAKYIEFKELESNKIYHTELSLWEKNTDLSPYQKLLRAENAKPEQLFQSTGDTLHLTGKQTLSNKIIIPKGKVVIIEAGTALDLLNRAAIISHSAIQFRGTKEQPITIHSSDKTANGIAVLQAEQKSYVSHTTFSNLNTFNYEGWSLSGAVNFYESEVEIKHSTFEKNHCEDALNIIRTDFLVANCTFKDIFADAFDSDFCTGKLTSSVFERVGNDAIDFSTSQIHIEDCNIYKIGDKGISGGENSTLWVKNTTINDCNIGTASKDLSNVSLYNVTISNSKYGLVLLQKKPEYGPAQIKTEQVEFISCKQNLLIEKKSVVNLEGKNIAGQEEKVARLFY